MIMKSTTSITRDISNLFSDLERNKGDKRDVLKAPG